MKKTIIILVVTSLSVVLLFRVRYKYFDELNYVETGQSILNNEYFNCVYKNNKDLCEIYLKYRIVYIYFDKVCSSCTDGMILDEISEYLNLHKKVKFVIFLPQSYNVNDLRNIRNNYYNQIYFSNICVDFQKVVNSRKKISKKLSLSGYYFITNKTGIVVDTGNLYSNPKMVWKKLSKIFSFLSSSSK